MDTVLYFEGEAGNAKRFCWKAPATKPTTITAKGLSPAAVSGVRNTVHGCSGPYPSCPSSAAYIGGLIASTGRYRAHAEGHRAAARRSAGLSLA